MTKLDQFLFDDWTGLRPCTEDNQPQRQLKKAALLTIRQAYAELIARGQREGQCQPLQTAVSPTEEAGHHARAAPMPQSLPGRRLVPLAALDECLTPLSTQTVPAPGLSGRRTVRAGSRPGSSNPPSCQPPSEPAAALTAQGLKLLHPVDSSSAFLRKHVSLLPATGAAQQQQDAQPPGSSSFLRHPAQEPQSAQQAQQQQQRQRQGRQWRVQSDIAKALQGGRRQGRSSGGGSSSFPGLGSEGGGDGFPFRQNPFAAAGDGRAGALPPHPTRFGTTSQALAALLQPPSSNNRSSGFAAANAMPSAGAAPPEQQKASEVESEAPIASSLPPWPRGAGAAASPSGGPGEQGGSAPLGQLQQEEGLEDMQQPGLQHPHTGGGDWGPAAGEDGLRHPGTQQQQLDSLPQHSERQQQRRRRRPDSLSQPSQQQQQQPDSVSQPSQQQQQQGAGGEQLLDEECTLPPPSWPEPVPFSSFTQPGGVGGAALHPLPSPGRGVVEGEPSSCSLPSLQQQQQQQHVPESPASLPDPSPALSCRFGALPSADTAHRAGACTPSFPAWPTLQAAAAQQPLQQGGLQHAQHAVQASFPDATPMWDSVPPTPAGLLDFSETAGDMAPGNTPPLSFPLSLLDRNDTYLDTAAPVGPEQWVASPRQEGPRGDSREQQPAVAETPAGPSLALPPQPSACQQRQQGEERSRQEREGAEQQQSQRLSCAQQQSGLQGRLVLPEAAGTQQQHIADPAGGVAARSFMAAPACASPAAAGSPQQALPSHRSPALQPNSAAVAALSPLSGALNVATVAGRVLGLQLRLPQPALVAVAAPIGRYAAVLLGSFARYEPTEVIVLKLGATAEEGCGGFRVVASVVVRLREGHPGWQLNSNSLQVAVDSGGEPILILSASLEPEELPTHFPHSISIISCGPGGPKLVLEVETPDAPFSVLWLGSDTLLAAGLGGAVQPIQLRLALRQYNLLKSLPCALYRGHYELTDLCRLWVAPGRAEELLGLSSDGMLTLWDLTSRSLLAVHSSHAYRLQYAQLVSCEQLAAADGGEAHSFLAQLRPRGEGRKGEGDVLGAVAVTGRRLTVGKATVQVKSLTATAMCGRLCLAGAADGLLHVWDLATGSSHVVDGLDGQSITCIAEVPAAGRAGEGNTPAAVSAPAPAAGGGVGGAAEAPHERGSRQAVLVTGRGGHCLLLDLEALREDMAACN